MRNTHTSVAQLSARDSERLNTNNRLQGAGLRSFDSNGQLERDTSQGQYRFNVASSS